MAGESLRSTVCWDERTDQSDTHLYSEYRELNINNPNDITKRAREQDVIFSVCFSQTARRGSGSVKWEHLFPLFQTD